MTKIQGQGNYFENRVQIALFSYSESSFRPGVASEIGIGAVAPVREC